ncbi:pyrimidine 5'-nucleotidase [Terasakiella sp. SH-1]|uniref:pyrimidine 5'-nucleotidase n=1 Tax=Terasakiella sp. SH-1 TaxID=2560057 RepID=UPI0010734AA2|nr:pyrimidine 5'-nucleotidase [Terasakiella sp. SH-1]
MIEKKNIESWVFDLDNTLYPVSANLFAQVDVRMRDFIAQYLRVDSDEAYKIQKHYFKTYGTTLRGLMTCHDMDPSPYLDYVHDIDVSTVEPSPELATAIRGLEGQKYIFTNASYDHAMRVMDRLEVSDCFDGIFDIVDAGYDPKPKAHVYDKFLEKFAIEPTKAVMIEDMARNLEPAANLGMACVWVENDHEWAKEGAEEPYVHDQTDDLLGWLQGL